MNRFKKGDSVRATRTIKRLNITRTFFVSEEGENGEIVDPIPNKDGKVLVKFFRRFPVRIEPHNLEKLS